MRSLADSDEVFESACDLNEVIDILCLVYIVYFRTYLMEILIWKKVNFLVRYVLVCIVFVVVVQVVVEDNIIVIPDVSVVNLNQVCSVFNMCF